MSMGPWVSIRESATDAVPAFGSTATTVASDHSRSSALRSRHAGSAPTTVMSAGTRDGVGIDGSRRRLAVVDAFPTTSHTINVRTN